MVSNTAASEGWVKSKDPKSGRVFYANHVTRKTQWDPPPGWTDEETAPKPTSDDSLPSNWEVLHDPSTGKPFYIDHERKITTWTRPTGLNSSATGSSSRSVTSHQSTTTSRSNAFQRILSSSKQQEEPKKPAAPAARLPPARNYHDTSYYHASTDQDFSDALPSLNFKVQKVPDKYRLQCPHCDTIFTMSKRRHHCRLCGDVFCDACSSHRVELPLEGPEFQQPVRICDFCYKDVEKGNFFSMRRYLTPLSLYEPSDEDDDEDETVATASNVAAALAALTTDLDSCLHNAASFEEKVTIPPDVLVPAICKHLHLRSTSDRAVCALASLLALGSIVMNNDFGHQVYTQEEGRQTLDNILVLLERSGSDRKTLYIQEQAARCMFYLTDRSILSTLHEEVDLLDMDRTLRSMLDHSSVSKNPALQRWAAACIRNLVVEDERRTCMAANQVAAAIASGQEGSMQYQSFLDQLVSTGGIMILCSLVGADDADTRAHATGSLGAILTATRNMDSSLQSLAEMTGTPKPPNKDGQVIRAIVSGGGCGSSISALLLSADHAVATMGCDFLSSLVLPLLQDARGTTTLPTNYSVESDTFGLGACREAALAMATGSCLPALLSLVRDEELGNRIVRPINLRKSAMETLAAVIMAVGQVYQANDSDAQVLQAIASLNAEGVVNVALSILASSQSLVSSKNNPASRIRECAGIMLSSMTLCSSEALEELQSKNALASLLTGAGDVDFKASSLRGDGAPRCLGVLETCSSILCKLWEDDSDDLLDRLLEAIDAGAVSTVARMFSTKMDWESTNKSVGAMKARNACCRILAALFSMAQKDATGIGPVRLLRAVDASAYSHNPTRNCMTATLATLQTSASFARRSSGADHYNAALQNLVEASLLAAGSFCGSARAPGDTDFEIDTAPVQQDDEFQTRVQEACTVSCDILVHRGRQGALLPTMLVGGFGEGTVNASLRLALAIAQNGSREQHAKLAMSGILVPIGDSLRNALSTGDLYRFSASLALVRFCGPHVAAGEAGGLQSVQDAIRVATNVLTLPVDPNADISQLEVQESLKSECISTLEALSKNASLWSAISKDALPSIVSYLHSSCNVGGVESPCRRDTRCAALKAVLRIVQLPSHAVSAAQAGLAEPLAKLMREGTNDTIPLLALEILHVLVSNSEARQHAQLLQCGVFQGVCTALGNAATSNPSKPTDSRADIAFWGLEILHFCLADVEGSGDFALVLESPVIKDIVDTAARETKFVRALLSSLLIQTNMVLPGDDDDEEEFKIPGLYGPPLVLVPESCAGFKDTHGAAVSLLFSLAVYACAIETPSSEMLWSTMLLTGEVSSDSSRLSATMCAQFLLILVDDGPLIPSNERKLKDFVSISRPLVRHRLLEGLKSCLEEQSGISVVPGESNNDAYMCALLVGYNVPEICLSLWRDAALVDVSYELIKLLMEEYRDDTLPLFVESKSAILSLFDMLTFDPSVDEVDVNVDEFRRLVASILDALAQDGTLTEAVDEFNVRSEAISALAAACLAEDTVSVVDDDEDAPATSSRMSSRCMQCLVELCTVEGQDSLHHRKMTLSQEEADAITKSLGKKICHMVISRFLERAKLEQYDVNHDDDIMDAPDVAMLCAIAQHESALEILRSIGGLHALCLIASEGELSAINALHKASVDDPSLVLDVDGHSSIIGLFSEDSKLSREHVPEVSRQVETAALKVLAQLCTRLKGRGAVTKAQHFDACLSFAIDAISSMVTSSSAQQDEDVADSSAHEAEENIEEALGEALDQEADEEEMETKSTEESALGNEPAVGNEEVPYEIVCKEDVSLEIAALRLLASIVQVADCRSNLLKDDAFVRASLLLAKESSSFELRYEAASFLVSVAPYSKVEQDDSVSLSVEDLVEVFRAALQIDPTTVSKCSTTTSLNTNLFQVTCMQGIENIFEGISCDLQHAVVTDAANRFMVLVKSFTACASHNMAVRAHGGSLACSLTLLMLRSFGKPKVQNVLKSQELLTSMIQLTQWRYDIKARNEEQEPLYWDAAVVHCLEIIAFVLNCTKESLEQSGISPMSLSRTVLMMARPGKAPRKACDFVTALRRIIDEKKDAAAIVAAQRIMSCLQD